MSDRLDWERLAAGPSRPSRRAFRKARLQMPGKSRRLRVLRQWVGLNAAAFWFLLVCLATKGKGVVMNAIAKLPVLAGVAIAYNRFFYLLTLVWRASSSEGDTRFFVALLKVSFGLFLLGAAGVLLWLLLAQAQEVPQYPQF